MNPPAPLLQILRDLHETTAQETANPILHQLVEALIQYNERHEVLATAVADLSMLEFERSKKKRKRTVFKPDESVAVGTDALLGGASDRENVAVGLCAGVELEGDGNVLIGPYAGYRVEGELLDVVAIGNRAMAGGVNDVRNVVALGAYSHPTGNDQVFLGDHQTNVQTLSAQFRRSDSRDMHEPKTCELGLDFVLSVQPIQYQEDFRDAYIDWDSKPIEPTVPRPSPELPSVSQDDPSYQSLIFTYRLDKTIWMGEMVQYEKDMIQFNRDLTQWIEDNKLVNIAPDGTHRGLRTHTGFCSTQLLEECERLGVDMAFVQDHSVNGGQSALAHSDSELLAVLWRAVQQLTAELRSKKP